MHIWNEICRKINEYKKLNSSENKVQDLWMTIFMELGWSKLKGEVVAQAEIPIGSNNKLKPDILLNVEGNNVIVVELKRTNYNSFSEQNSQLISYMLQLKLKVGILIGSNIQVYYDDLTDAKKPIKISTINFLEDNVNGIEFFDLLKRIDFQEGKLSEYCENLLKIQNECIS